MNGPAENTIPRGLTWFILIFYLAILTKMVAFKQSPSFIKNHFLHHYSWKAVKENGSHANLKPFATISLYLGSNRGREYAWSNVAGNIVGFIPFGILVPLLFRSLRTTWKMVTATFLLSLSFELFQLVSVLGSFDVDDLMLNTLGGLLGYWIFSFFHRGPANKQSIAAV